MSLDWYKSINCSLNCLKIFFRIGFHACVWVFAVKTVKDTQCGFKVMPSVTFPTNFHYFSSSFWKGKLRKFFSIPFTSRDGLLTWRCWRYSDKKRFLYLCDFFSAKYDLTFYIWWECYYFQVAEMLQIPLGEVSVRWQEIDGSKLSPLLAAIEMFRLLHLTSHVTNWWYLRFSGIFSCCG